MGTTLAQIATRAGVSPGLVAHYFGDKDGLLDAAFRSLARRVGNHVRARLRQVSTPRGRIQAVIDANLAPEEFEQRTGTAWLAFWGQVLHVPSLKRVQSVYQRRTLSNLRSSLKNLVPPDEAQRLAAMIAAMIDGVWLRAALSGWREADSESARALLTAFVDGRLEAGGARRERRRHAGARRAIPAPRPASDSLPSIPRPARVLGYVTAAGSAPGQRGGARRAEGAGGLGRDDGRRTRARAAPRRRHLEVAQSGTRRAGNARHRQAHPGDARGGRRLRRGLLRILCRPRAELERRAYRSRLAGLRLHATRAARRGRRHRRLELPAANRLLEGRAGAGLRQCHDIQTCGADAVYRRQAAGDPARGGSAARRVSGACRDSPTPAGC